MAKFEKAKELSRDDNRMETRVDTQREILLDRKEDHMSHEFGVRPRSYYDEPDYNVIAEFSDRTSSLMAPPMPGYVQRWISIEKDNGAHIHNMIRQEGWSLRDPMTVPSTAGLNTMKWGEYDTVSAGGELVLCYMRKDFFEAKQAKKATRNQAVTNDRAGFGQDLYGATRSERDELGNQYSRVVGAYSDSKTVYNDKPY